MFGKNIFCHLRHWRIMPLRKVDDVDKGVWPNCLSYPAPAEALSGQTVATTERYVKDNYNYNYLTHCIIVACSPSYTW